MSYTTSSPSTAPGSSPNLSRAASYRSRSVFLRYLRIFARWWTSLVSPRLFPTSRLKFCRWSQRFRILYVRRAAVVYGLGICMFSVGFEGGNAPCTSGRPGSCGFDGSEKAATIRLRFSNAMPLALAFFKEITRASILVLNRSIGTRFVVLLLQFGRRNVSLTSEGRRGNGMKGRKLRQSVEKYLLLPLSNAVVQMLGHGDRAHRVIDDLGRLQVLLGDDDLRKVTVGPFRLVSRSVSNDNVRTSSFGSLSLSARLARFSFWTARALRLRKDAAWTTAEEWNEDCEFDEATVRLSGPIQCQKFSVMPPVHISGKLTSHGCSQHRC
jgi:hypothetical protein